MWGIRHHFTIKRERDASVRSSTRPRQTKPFMDRLNVGATDVPFGSKIYKHLKEISILEKKTRLKQIELLILI